MPLAGRPMIEWSLEAFRACESVASIVVAVPPGHESTTSAASDLRVVAGGATRAAVGRQRPGGGRAPSWSRSTTRPGRCSRRSWSRPWSPRLDADPEAAGVIAAAPVTDTIKRSGAASSTGTRIDFPA